MRRLRQFSWSRELVCEYRLTVKDLIWPLFILPGQGKQDDVSSLPGVKRFSVDLMLGQVEAAIAAGIPAIALFPVTPSELKTEDGREALNSKNLICTATRCCPRSLWRFNRDRMRRSLRSLYLTRSGRFASGRTNRK